MKNYLDDIDHRLINLLQLNARESTTALAQKLSLARTTIVARIARLEKNKIIAGYGVRLGQGMDDTAVRAYCSLSVSPKNAAKVIKTLATIAEIEEVSSVSGAFDYFALIRCNTHEQLDDLLDRIGNVEGVNQTQTSIVLNRKIDRRG